MERKLTPKERERLMKSHRKEREGRTRDRIKAVLALDDGYSYSEVARILLLDDETIRRHVKDYFSNKKLKPKSGGSDSHLNEKESMELRAHLQERTYCYVKEICIYVKHRFHKNYSISGMRKWLHGNDFRYKKPHGVPAKADKVKQEAFL